jgi:hypothetical protein
VRGLPQRCHSSSAIHSNALASTPQCRAQSPLTGPLNVRHSTVEHLDEFAQTPQRSRTGVRSHFAAVDALRTLFCHCKTSQVVDHLIDVPRHGLIAPDQVGVCIDEVRPTARQVPGCS